MNIAGGTIPEFTTETVCVGPFQDKNLDLTDGNLNTTGIGEGDLTDGLHISLVELAAEDTGAFYAFASEHALTSCIVMTTTPCASGKSCIGKSLLSFG